MMQWQLFAYVAGTVFLLTWMVFPLIKARLHPHADEDQLADERAASLLAALHKLETKPDSVGSEDRAAIERRLRLALARLYAARNIKPGAGDQAAACGCGQALEEGYGFCPACGRRRTLSA